MFSYLDLEKFSKLMKKYLIYIVIGDIIIAIIIGNYFPSLGHALKPFIYIPIFLMLVPMMTAANVTGIKHAFQNYKIVFSAVFLNFIITPPLGYLLAKLFLAGEPHLLSIGYILNMVTPCSDMVITWTAFAAGSVEVATMIVGLSLLLAIIFIPLWMWILTHTWVAVPIHLIVKDMLIIVLIPLILGYAIQRWIVHKKGIEGFKRIKPALPAISSIGMYFMIFIAMAMVAPSIVKNPYYVFLTILSMGVFYIVLFFIAVIWSKFVKIEYKDAISLIYSVTAKNLSITIALATVTWGGLSVLVPAFDPVIQVPLMIVILALSRKLKTSLWKNDKTD